MLTKVNKTWPIFVLFVFYSILFYIMFFVRLVDFVLGFACAFAFWLVGLLSFFFGLVHFHFHSEELLSLSWRGPRNLLFFLQKANNERWTISKEIRWKIKFSSQWWSENLFRTNIYNNLKVFFLPLSFIAVVALSFNAISHLTKN